jgi:predicted metal-dependent phosphoesterase TrpH
VVAEAAAREVGLLAITDHDTTEGIGEVLGLSAMGRSQAPAQRAGVVLVPAVELSADTEKEDIHILGYFVDPASDVLQAGLAKLRELRNRRNAAILERLSGLGVDVDPERVAEVAGRGSVGRPHIAAAMAEAGHVSSPQLAFQRYLARGQPAFVPRARLEARDACALVRQAGGIPVLAHPAKIVSRETLEEVLASGVEGLEVFHCDHTAQDVQAFLGLARERSLLVTGGSDSHGPRWPRPVVIGSVTMPAWVADQVLGRAPVWWKGRGLA